LKKLPICKACISSLCFSCQDKLDKGLITQFDIDLAIDFTELEQGKFPELKNASFFNVVEVGDIAFLVIGQGNKSFFKKELLDYIKELYEIPEISLIEKGTPKAMLEQIIAPAKMIGIDQIYIPTGEIEYRVNIPKEDKNKIMIPIDLLEKAASLIIRGITKISFT
jgi:hypothetical protein